MVCLCTATLPQPGMTARRTRAVAAERAARFLALHRPGEPLLMPNPWDAGSARVLASLGFAALATTSSGFAATLGRLDGAVSRDEALAQRGRHRGRDRTCRSRPTWRTGTPTSPTGVARHRRPGPSGPGWRACPSRTTAAAPRSPSTTSGWPPSGSARPPTAAHAGPVRLVLTGRCENFLRNNPDLADTIARLQRYQEAGADVLYAPGLTRPEDIRAVVTSVDRPVNVLAFGGVPSVAELAGLGVARISVGGAFAYAAIDALATAARELRDAGTYGYLKQTVAGRQVAGEAFRP